MASLILGPDGAPIEIDSRTPKQIEFDRQFAAQWLGGGSRLMPAKVMDKLKIAMPLRKLARARLQEESERPSNSKMRPVMEEYDDKAKDTVRGPILISVPKAGDV